MPAARYRRITPLVSAAVAALGHAAGVLPNQEEHGEHAEHTGERGKGACQERRLIIVEHQNLEEAEAGYASSEQAFTARPIGHFAPEQPRHGEVLYHAALADTLVMALGQVAPRWYDLRSTRWL